MHAEILTKEQYKKWDDFAYAHSYSSIHQTSKWAHFQSNVPSRDKYWIIALFDGVNAKGKILAGTVLIKHKLPKNYCWLYAPRGPLLSYENPKLAKEQMALLLNKIKEIAKEERAIFFRIDPLIEIQTQEPSSSSLNPSNSKLTQSKSLHFPSFHFSHLGYQPEDTLIIDLNKPEEEILKQMKEKGRYNVRLSVKKGIKIVEVDPFRGDAQGQTKIQNQTTAQSQIESYFRILQETLQRDKFYGHGIGFYKNMIEKLAPDQPSKTRSKAMSEPSQPTDKSQLPQGFAKMYLAEFTPVPTDISPNANAPATTTKPADTYIAGIIVTFHKDTAIYYYGASSNEYRNLMAPYLLQWHAMTEAKSLGCTKYDLLGIAPPTKTDELGPQNHPWRGVTEFKRKFGGTYVKYLPPQEYSFKPLPHFLYKVLKKLRKTLR